MQKVVSLFVRIGAIDELPRVIILGNLALSCVVLCVLCSGCATQDFLCGGAGVVHLAVLANPVSGIRASRKLNTQESRRAGRNYVRTMALGITSTMANPAHFMVAASAILIALTFSRPLFTTCLVSRVPGKPSFRHTGVLLV